MATKSYATVKVEKEDGITSLYLQPLGLHPLFQVCSLGLSICSDALFQEQSVVPQYNGGMKDPNNLKNGVTI